jgi:hypothetical protein
VFHGFLFPGKMYGKIPDSEEAGNMLKHILDVRDKA